MYFRSMIQSTKIQNSFIERNQTVLTNIHFVLLTLALISHFFVTKAVAFTSICYGIATGFSLVFFVLNRFKINKKAIFPVISILGMLLCVILNTIITNGVSGLSTALLTNKYYMAIALFFLVAPEITLKQIKILFLIFGIGYFIVAFIGVFRYYMYDYGYIFKENCTRIGVVDSCYIPFSIYHCSLVIYLSEAIVLFSVFYKLKNSKNKTQNWLVVISIIFITIFIHLIGSRLGLLIFYSLVLYFIFLNIKNKILPLKYIAILLLILPIFATSIYFGVSSIRMRVQDTINDYRSINYEVPAFWVTNFNYRVAGIVLAFDQYPENKYKGIGYNNESKSYKNAVLKRYGFESTFDVMPHNQFIKSLIVLGLPLCILFFLCFFLPLFSCQHKVLVGLYIVNILGFMTDTPVEIKHWLYGYCIILPLVFLYLKADSNSVIDKNK